MGGIKIEKFASQLPAWDERFLPENQAAASLNAYLYSGAAVGWRTPKILHALTNSAAKFAYRLPTITQGIAAATLNVILAPHAGDTVTVGEITYTFRTTPVNPYDVLIGSSAAQSAQALFMALNFGSYDTAVVGNYSASNPAIAAANPYLGFPFSFTGGTNTPGANTVVLVPVTPTATMNISSVNLVPGAASATAKFTGVVYENTNQINAAGTAYINIPTTLIATGAQVVGCGPGGPVTSAFPVNVTLQGGSTYWIGFIMDTAIPLGLSSTGTLGVSNSNAYSAGPPNPFQTTELSGVTTGGTTVGTLQTQYNLGQPNWQIWGAMSLINFPDAENTIAGANITLDAPAFGSAFNQTPVAENTGGTRLYWGGATFFSGGANQTADTTITGASQWIEALDQDTNVLRTPVVDDTFQRYYLASPSLPPMYNTYARIQAGQPAFYLGVPAPPIPPTLTVTGGGNPTQIGFPGSTTPNQSGNVNALLGTNNYLLLLYPMQSSVGVVLNSINLQLTQLGPTDIIQFFGIIFADTTATNPAAASAPGDLIAYANTNGSASGASSPTLPLALSSSFETVGVTGSGVTLQPNTQYWVGVVVTNPGPGSTVQFGLGDLGTKGYSAFMPADLPTGTDPSTGALVAPSMAANFPDWQLWADLTPGGSGEAQEETRAYVYTWVTAYGEEGPPSPPALLDAYDNATWQVGLQPPLPEDMGTLRNIVQTNIYRTMSSVQGGTVFFLVQSLAAGATVFIDDYTDDVVAENLILPSTTWYGPPATLQGMVTMPNGMMAGFKANEVWFCEPFRPHAWPAQYVMTTDYPIVGLGVSGVTLVAATQTNPNTFTGVNPSTMSQTRIPLPEPCTSRGGIISTENGVYYPSVNGLIKVSGNGYAVNTTQGWITREKWDALTPQKFVRATKNVSTYFAFGTTGVTNGQADATVAQQGYTIELSEVQDAQSFTIWPQVGGHRIGFGSLGSPNRLNVDNVLCDPWSGVTLLISGGSVLYYDFDDPAPVLQKYIWRSKKFQSEHKDNFSAFRVWFDIPPGGPQTPPPTRTEVPFAVSAAPTLAFVPGMFGVVRVIADGNYVTERELRSSTELMRVASAQKYTTWQFEIEAVVSVSNVKMATSVKELGKMK